MNNDLMFSSRYEAWDTPQDFFDKQNQKFKFNLDVCASIENAKCKRYFTQELDGLSQSWANVCWMNKLSCWIHPNIITLLYENKDMFKMQNGTIVNTEILPQKADIERWVAFCMQRVQQKGICSQAVTETEKSNRKGTAKAGKGEILSFAKGNSEQEETYYQVQSFQEAKNYLIKMGLDFGDVGNMQSGMESFVRILWFFNKRINSGSFYPFVSSHMSGNHGEQYNTGLFKMQHDEKAHTSTDLVKGQKSACKNCGLSECEGSNSTIAYMNPPYGREIGKWIEKAYRETRNPGTVVVALLPARTDTKYFHTWIYNGFRVETIFLKGRLIFGSDEYWQWLWEQEIINGKKNTLFGKIGKKNSAPFPSMLCIFGTLD